MNLSNEEKTKGALRWPRVISVSSGKGGVGKTNVVANLAFAFTQVGKKVLVLDADLGLANINVLLGLMPRYTIEHLLKKEKGVFDILMEGPGGMFILPASSGVLELVDLNEGQKIFLLSEMDILAEAVDFLLIDTSSGISSNVLYFNLAAEESIIIATPEPTSITNAYALLKILFLKYKKKTFMILVNSAQDEKEAIGVYKKILSLTDRFLGCLSIDYLGFIPFDEKIPLAVKNQRPVLELFPEASSSQSFKKISQILIDKPRRNEGNGSVQFFWRHLLRYHQLVEKEGVLA
jgi:flagellar biosynthesis protein FlhG